ncbi:MAG TPA: serine hydrolase domain-containing protein [Acidimicrobiia bacterium]|nr:serine hydrolase domain-containing protein [Acidimicrobiia bacterium]
MRNRVQGTDPDRRITRASLSLALLCVLCLTIWAGAPLGAAEISDEDSNPVERAATAIERQFDEMGVGQASYAVISDAGQTVAGYGAASPDTPFVIGSVSKSFTALAILQLVERGLIALDSPVTDYIDWFTTADPTASITVRHLLNQTSGLSTLDGSRNAFTPETSLEDRVRLIETYDLVSEPGSEFNYSNLNYAVLGLIVQKVSGVGYGEFVEQEIFGPLGMDNSFSEYALAQANGLATGTITVFGLPVDLSQTAFPGSVPDGYLISTAADMAEYARFQMGDGSSNGRRLLSAGNMAMMHTPAIAAEGGQHLDHYAMGWRTGSIDGQPLISHDGNTFGFHANVALLPDIGGAVVVLMARNGGLSMVTGPENAGLEALAGETPGVSRSYTIAWIVADSVLGLVVLGSVVSLVLRRRRWREVPRRAPRRWPAIVQVVAGVLIGTSVVLLAASMSGGIDVVAFRLLWALAPDVTILAVAIPLPLIAAAMATFLERRTTRQLLTPVSGSERSVEHV